ncbi:MAG: hypothetical protein ACKO5E_17285 [bacterium]
MMKSLFSRRQSIKPRTKVGASGRRADLHIDHLDERVLLAGNVQATMSPFVSGQLTITGDIASNSIKISPSPSNPLLLRVQGNLTSVNTVAYVDFVASSISSIQIDMTQGGADTVALENFKVLNKLSFTSAGTGNDSFTTTNVTANQVDVSANVGGTASAIVTMTNSIVAGLVNIRTGNGSDRVTLDTGRIGTVSINTGLGTANDTVTVTNFLGTATVPGIGVLQIVTPDGDDTINVNKTSMTSLSINAGNGNNRINVDSPLIRGTASIFSGNGNDTIDFKATSVRYLSINADGGTNRVRVYDTNVVMTMSIVGATNLSISNTTVGSISNIISGPNSTIIVNGLTVNSGNLFVQAGNNSYVGLTNVNLLGGNAIVNVADACTVVLDTLFVSDEIYINAGNLTNRIDVLNTQAESLHINNGVGDTVFNIVSCVFIGGDGVSLNTGDGNHRINIIGLDVATADPMFFFGLVISTGLIGDNDVYLSQLNVLDGMVVNLGNGINTVAVDAVVVDWGVINAGTGASDVLIDYSPGTSSGFVALGFEGFI